MARGSGADRKRRLARRTRGRAARPARRPDEAYRPKHVRARLEQGRVGARAVVPVSDRVEEIRRLNHELRELYLDPMGDRPRSDEEQQIADMADRVDELLDRIDASRGAS